MTMKENLKEALRFLLFVLKHKSYKVKTNEEIVVLDKIGKPDRGETFFGYYDHSPEREGKILYHEILPNGQAVRIVVEDKLTKERQVIGESPAFNWQMGSRAIWIDDDTVSYNDFDGQKYVCRWFSLAEHETIHTFDCPLQDYRGGSFFLGVNYQRFRSFAKEYAYYCLPEMSESEYDDYEHDGIWRTDIATGEVCLILSIADILKCEYVDNFVEGKHFVNHVMISPGGDKFIFIHRYYVNGVRYDRLMCYDFHQLKVLMGERIQSHYCWLDNDTVFGYGEYEGKRGFNSVNVKTGIVTKHEKLTSAHPRDGHPSASGEWIVIDDYPNLSRMQPLIAYNYKTHDIKWLGEFFHDLKHKEYTRCDLHPRISEDGRTVWIDTISLGRRRLIGLNISKLMGGGKTLVLIDTLYKMYALRGKEEYLSRFLPLMKDSRGKDYLYRAMRKVHLSLPLPFQNIWFANWTNVLWEYDTVVLGETGNSYNVAKYIKKKYPSLRVIIWFRNSVSHSVNPLRFKKDICEVWSFDRADCERYGLKHNPQFYYKSSTIKAPKSYEYDVFFVGKDKGRLNLLLDIEKNLKQQGLRTNFCIVGHNCSYMSYPEILSNISKSRAVLDVQGDWQKGITLRPLEALFYKKKLITNSEEVKHADFYNDVNIKIISSSENLKGLSTFLNSPYVEIPSDIINKYEYHSWVARFQQ